MESLTPIHQMKAKKEKSKSKSSNSVSGEEEATTAIMDLVREL